MSSVMAYRSEKGAFEFHSKSYELKGSTVW